MKLISLSQGKFAQVDDEDFEYLSQFNWFAVKRKYTFYALRYVWLGNHKQTTVSMHRDIIKTPKGMDCDHENHNGLDNQKRNLRNCTKSENQKNRVSSDKSSSKYLGVFKSTHKRKEKGGTKIFTYNYWVAQIRPSSEMKNIHLGCFPYTDEGEKSAAKAYNDAALKYHKEFSNTNKI